MMCSTSVSPKLQKNYFSLRNLEQTPANNHLSPCPQSQPQILSRHTGIALGMSLATCVQSAPEVWRPAVQGGVSDGAGWGQQPAVRRWPLDRVNSPVVCSHSSIKHASLPVGATLLCDRPAVSTFTFPCFFCFFFFFFFFPVLHHNTDLRGTCVLPPHVARDHRPAWQ